MVQTEIRHDHYPVGIPYVVVNVVVAIDHGNVRAPNPVMCSVEEANRSGGLMVTRGQGAAHTLFFMYARAVKSQRPSSRKAGAKIA